MKNSLLLASGNPEKQRVAREVWCPEVEILTPQDFALTIPDTIEGEDGYEENVRIKANWLSRRVHQHPVVADDSGMEIAGLNGAPGVKTRRWAQSLNDQDLLEKTVSAIKALSESERACVFVIYAVLLDIRGQISVVTEKDNGILLLEPKGEMLQGHPLASLLYIPQHGKTLAELRHDSQSQFLSKDVRAHLRLKELFLKSIL